MKSTLAICLMLMCTVSWAQRTRTFSHIDDHTDLDNGSKGWGSCSTCAGGANTTDQFAMYFRQPSPSLDGSSMGFFAYTNLPYSNVLWYYKLGPHDEYDRFQFQFAYTVDEAATKAQALEFDTFQFISGNNYTFGTQCDLATGTWEVFNHANQSWVPLNISCAPVAGDWYRVTWNMHRSQDQTLTYDSFVVRHFDCSGTNLLDQNSYTVNRTVGSAPAPPGYADNLAVQFQIDLGGSGGMASMWVDEVSLMASGSNWHSRKE